MYSIWGWLRSYIMRDTAICCFSVRFFCRFRFFCYCIFLFVLLLEQGYFNVTLLPMQPVGLGYPPPAAPPTTAAGATAAGATPQPPPHAAVQPGLQQPSTTPWSMQPQVSCRAHYCFRCACYALVVPASCLVVRTTQVVVARALSCFPRAFSCFPQMLSQPLTPFSPTQPLWPAPQPPLRAAS